MNADLDYLYAHHAVGLCPEERCVTALANLTAIVNALQRLDAISRVDPRNEVGEIEFDDALAQSFTALNPGVRPVWQGRVASREGSGT